MAAAAKELKQKLRQAILDRRRALPAAAKAAGSAAIADRLIAWKQYQAAASIMVYLAMPDEPDLDAVVTDALGRGKQVCVPMLRPEYGFMDAAAITGAGDLITGKLNLKMPDPARAKLVDPRALDLIVVPGVAFDRGGNRLGMGAGYYDRFLPQAPRAGLLGVAWQFQIVEEVPRGEYDVAMHQLLTEGGFVSCG